MIGSSGNKIYDMIKIIGNKQMKGNTITLGESWVSLNKNEVIKEMAIYQSNGLDNTQCTCSHLYF